MTVHYSPISLQPPPEYVYYQDLMMKELPTGQDEEGSSSKNRFHCLQRNGIHETRAYTDAHVRFRINLYQNYT